MDISKNVSAAAILKIYYLIDEAIGLVRVDRATDLLADALRDTMNLAIDARAVSDADVAAKLRLAAFLTDQDAGTNAYDIGLILEAIEIDNNQIEERLRAA
jgi:hypothetical protein